MACNAALPSYFQIGSIWYKLMPRPVETIPPMIINPVINATWTYRNPGNLATGGIYTEQDLDQLRDHINFPMEKPSILNIIARYLGGRQVTSTNPILDILNDEEIYGKLAEGTVQKIW